MSRPFDLNPRAAALSTTSARRGACRDCSTAGTGRFMSGLVGQISLKNKKNSKYDNEKKNLIISSKVDQWSYKLFNGTLLI